MNILTDVIPFMATMSTAQKTIALFNSSYITQAAVAQAAQRDASGVLPVASADLPMLDSPALNVNASPSTHSLLGAIPSPGFQNLSGTVGRTSDIDLQFWFPLLFGLYEITMSCELEVRTRYVWCADGRETGERGMSGRMRGGRRSVGGWRACWAGCGGRLVPTWPSSAPSGGMASAL